jgi:hypothetical protein
MPNGFRSLPGKFGRDIANRVYLFARGDQLVGACRISQPINEQTLPVLKVAQRVPELLNVGENLSGFRRRHAANLLQIV